MVGFSCDRFVDPLSDDLKCGICLLVFDNAVITACGHTYCYDCLKQWLTPQRKECPECRQPVATRRRSRGDVNDNNVILIGLDVVVNNRGINSLVSKLRIKCDFESKGCPEVMALESMATHLKTCGYKVCQKCGLSDTSSDGHNCIEMLKRIMNGWKNMYKMAKIEKDLSKQLEEIYNELEMKYKSLKTRIKQMDNKVKTLESKCKQSDDLRQHFEIKFNELNEEIATKLKTMPIRLSTEYLKYGNEVLILNSIEFNNIGVKLKIIESNNQQNGVTKKMMISFKQINKLCFYSKLNTCCIETSIQFNKLDGFAKFVNNTKNNSKSKKSVPELMIGLNETISEWLAKLLINKCKDVNSDCDCSYTTNQSSN